MELKCKPRIEKKAFLIVGINKFLNWNDDFGKIIQVTEEELENRLNELKNILDSKKRIKYFYSETGAQDGFNYLQCVEVTNFSGLPQGFIHKDLALSEYAVFAEKNGEEGTIGKYARNNWLPQSEYIENYAIFGDLEVSNILDKNSHEFWLPIVKK